jgi:L-iditol 2-dehydrogenase
MLNMLRTLLTEPFHIKLESSPVPEPGAGEVLIRLVMTGICGSDVHMFKNGHTVEGSLTIGHEGIGVIEKAGADISEKRVGERIVIEPNIPCSTCPECRIGRGNICRNKRIIGVKEPGCFAEYIVIPDAFAHSIPDSINEIDAVAIEPATVALAALNRSNAKPGDTIAVIGLGSIGMLLTHIALSFGYKVLVSELNESKIKVATDMGATLIHMSHSNEGSVKTLEKVYEEEEVVSVFECAGSEKTATLAIEAAPRGAEIILLGLSEAGATFNPRMISRKGNNIIPSLIYDHPVDFKRCIRLIEYGKIKPGIIVSRFFPLEHLEEALSEAVKGNEIKIVIRIPGH